VAHYTYTDGLAAVALVECSASSELWQHLKKFIPPATGGEAGSVVARKFSDRGGTAYLLEHEGTVVLAAATSTRPDRTDDPHSRTEVGMRALMMLLLAASPAMARTPGARNSWSTA